MSQRARLPLNQGPAFVESSLSSENRLDIRYVASHRHWHIDDSTDDTLWGMIWTTSTVPSTTCGTRRRQSAPRCAAERVPVGPTANFNDLLFDLRAYSIVTCLPSGRNHQGSPFSSASIHFFPKRVVIECVGGVTPSVSPPEYPNVITNANAQ